MQVITYQHNRTDLCLLLPPGHHRGVEQSLESFALQRRFPFCARQPKHRLKDTLNLGSLFERNSLGSLLDLVANNILSLFSRCTNHPAYETPEQRIGLFSFVGEAEGLNPLQFAAGLARTLHLLQQTAFPHARLADQAKDASDAFTKISNRAFEHSSLALAADEWCIQARDSAQSACGCLPP